MILIGYRHGLRASELCDLQWSQVELASGRLHVRRAKNGSPSVLQREQRPFSHVFMTERDGPMTPKAFHALFGRIGAPEEHPAHGALHRACAGSIAIRRTLGRRRLLIDFA